MTSATQETFFRVEVKLFSQRNKTVSLVFLDNNIKRYDMQNTRKAKRKLGFASVSLNTFLLFFYVIVFSIIVYKHARYCFIPLIERSTILCNLVRLGFRQQEIYYAELLLKSLHQIKCYPKANPKEFVSTLKTKS